MLDSHRRRAIVDLILPALLVTLQLLLFGPHTIYAWNEAEFTASFWALARHLLLPASIVFVTLTGLGLALSGRWRRTYIALLFSLGIVSWVQANLLVADYGPLDGSAIDWSIQSWRNKYEVTLWLAVPAVAVLAAKKIAPVAPFGSGILVALQAALLIASTVQADRRTRAAAWRGPSESMFELSRKQNAFHLVLDGFHSDIFSEILEAERPLMDRDFSGFVFFEDHAGAFPTTMVSVPAMLTGTVYRNEAPLQEYIRNHFKKGSIFGTMRAQGYRVDDVSELPFDNLSATRFYRMPRPYVSYEAYTRFSAWQLADLSLFRHAPHILRSWIYNDQAWRLQNTFGENYGSGTSGRRYHPVNGAAVLDEFAHRMRVATNEPMYKFIHVGIPHLPVAVNAACEFTGVRRFSRGAFRGQARCGVSRVAAFLNRLRTLGVYDSSLIVISSDHGISIPPRQFAHNRRIPAGELSDLAGKAMALLLVKPPGSSGPLRVSQAPTAITDIPVTVADALGVEHRLPGTSVLKVAESVPRMRTFGSYVWDDEDWRADYFEHLDLLEIQGPLRDGNSWTLRSSLYPPDTDEAQRARGLYEPHRSSSGIVYRWSGPNVFLHGPATARGFEIRIKSIAPKPQTVSVAAGGRVLQRITLSDHRWVTLAHRLDPPADPANVWVELRVDPPFKQRGTTRNLGVMTRGIKWIP
jgi:hypothetical protein